MVQNRVIRGYLVPLSEKLQCPATDYDGQTFKVLRPDFECFTFWRHEVK